MFVLIHGGGFCLGHNAHPGIDSQALARLHGITVVSISYRLAPESKFPTAPNDVWDTLKWVSSAANARTLGMECLKELFPGGSSAGANLAAVTAQRWVTEKLQPPVSGIWLNAPMLLHAAIVPERFEQVWISRNQNANAMILNENTLSYIETAYAPDVLSPQYSPFNNQNPHQRLPPVYFQVYGQDPLRDDGLIYEKVLRENGVQTKLDVYPGIPYCFADVFKDFVLAEKYQSDNFKAMIKLPKSKVRAIGISNHTINHLEALIAATGVVPAVNHVERHPFLRQDELVTYCKAKGIHITAYSAFGNNMFNVPLIFSHQEVKDVAEKVSSETKTRVTPSQVLLAWAQHGGHSVIPKSVTPTRITENFREVGLSEEHLKAVDSIGAQQRRYNIPYIANKPMWDINIFGDESKKSATHRVIV